MSTQPPERASRGAFGPCADRDVCVQRERARTVFTEEIEGGSGESGRGDGGDDGKGRRRRRQERGRQARRQR